MRGNAPPLSVNGIAGTGKPTSIPQTITLMRGNSVTSMSSRLNRLSPHSLKLSSTLEGVGDYSSQKRPFTEKTLVFGIKASIVPNLPVATPLPPNRHITGFQGGMPEALRSQSRLCPLQTTLQPYVRAWGPPQTKTETRTEPKPNKGKPTKSNRTKPKHEKSETINQIAVLIAIYTYTKSKRKEK